MRHSIKRRYQILRSLRLIARIISSIFIIAIIIVLMGEGFGVSETNSTNWLGFVYFPFGVVLGFIIGWKYELIGGLISIVSLCIFFFAFSITLGGQIPNFSVFGIALVPALLFVISGIYGFFAIGRLKDRISDNAIH